jgi:hypothetical protein
MNPAREGVMDLRSATAAATNLKAGVDIAKALPDMKVDNRAAVAEKTRELASRLNPVFCHACDAALGLRDAPDRLHQPFHVALIGARRKRGNQVPSPRAIQSYVRPRLGGLMAEPTSPNGRGGA